MKPIWWTIFFLNLAIFVFFLRQTCKTGTLLGEEVYAKPVDLTNKKIIVTGASSGIGFHIALGLSQWNATVIIACRDANKGQHTLKRLKDLSGKDHIHFIQMNLASKASMERFVNEYVTKFGYFDVLINNAATLTGNYAKTEEGFSEIVGTNHLGTMYLTHLLLPYVSRNGRIIVKSSLFHHLAAVDLDDLLNHDFNGTVHGLRTYSRSKLLNVLFSQELAEHVSKYPDHNMSILTVSPGMSCTNMTPLYFQTDFMKFAYAQTVGRIFKTPNHAAQASIAAATDPKLDGILGDYYAQAGLLETIHPQAMNVTFRKLIWKESCKLLKIPEDCVEQKLNQRTKINLK